MVMLLSACGEEAHEGDDDVGNLCMAVGATWEVCSLDGEACRSDDRDEVGNSCARAIWPFISCDGVGVGALDSWILIHNCWTLQYV